MTRKRIPDFYLIMLILLISNCTIYGQSGASEGELTQNDEINDTLVFQDVPVIISGRAIHLKLPAALMQIHPEHLQRDPDVSIAPALNRITGVYMHSGALNTNRITIRGIGNRSPFSTTKLRAYLDDIPLTNGDGETTIEDIDLSLIHKIDVWKGPTASVFGAGLGGMIHMKTRGSENKIPTSIKNAITIGSYGLVRNVAEINYGNSAQTLQIGANFNTTNSDGYRENNSYKRQGGSILAKYKSGKNSETTIFGNHITIKAFIPSSLDREDYDESPEKAAFTWNKVKGFEDYTRNLLGVSHRGNLAELGGQSLINTTSVFASNRESYESRPFNILEEKSNSIGLRSSFELRPNSVRNRLFPLFTIGIETYRENYDWQTFETLDGIQGGILSDNEETRKYINLFAQSYFSINDKATIFSGVNYNNTRYTYNDLLMIDGKDKSGKYSFDGVFSPHLGINYQIKYKVSLFATVSHGFSPPSLSETLTPDGKINPEIAPERGWNFELGSRGKIASKLTYELTAYSMRIKDLIVARRIAEDQFVGLNAGKTKHNGIELFLEYELLKANNIQLIPFLTYTYSGYTFDDFVDNSNDFSGNELTGTPPHQLNAGIDFSTKIGAYGNVNYRYIDAFPMRDDNTIYSDSYKVTNFKFGYKKKYFEKLECDISMGVRNVFNEKYASMILINAGSFGGNAPRYYYPGLPRNYFASISLNYLLN